MPFCIEYFEKNNWKIIKSTIRNSKEEAEEEKKKIESWVVDDDPRSLTVKERYRVRRLRNKEAQALMASHGKKAVNDSV